MSNELCITGWVEGGGMGASLFWPELQVPIFLNCVSYAPITRSRWKSHALQHLLVHPSGDTPWTIPRRSWLNRIAAQPKVNVLVDCSALDGLGLIFKREGGGFNRLDKIFNDQLQPVLAASNDVLWAVQPQSA